MERIRMLEIAPLSRPRVIEVDHTLETLQELVGGTIQAVFPWEDRVAALMDDDGKAKGYPANRVLEDEDGNPYDVIVGTFYICGLGQNDFISLSDELVEKYREKFKYPEMFLWTRTGQLAVSRLGACEPMRFVFR